MTTREYYRLVFDGHSGRDGSDSIRVMQNATETDIIFHCYYQDGTEYVFQEGDTGGGSFIDNSTGLDYAITGTVTPTAGGNILTWVRSNADVALPSTYSINFEIVSTVPKSDYSFSAVYVILPIASGLSFPVSPSLTKLIKAWAQGGGFEMTAAPTYDVIYTHVVKTVPIEWPDGSAGTYTATTIDSVWQEATGWNITHDNSGLTVVGTGLVRDSNGLITANETITVS